MPTAKEILAIKAAVRERHGFKCADCEMSQERHLKKFKKALDVHRIDPQAEYTLEGCVALCQKCHWKRHATRNGPVMIRRGYHRVITRRDGTKEWIWIKPGKYRLP